MKVYFERKEKIFAGLNNGIYYDEEGKPGSSLHLLLSKDGIEWHKFPFNPIIYPEEGWKRAFVYQVDLKRVNNELSLTIKNKNFYYPIMYLLSLKGLILIFFLH